MCGIFSRYHDNSHKWLCCTKPSGKFKALLAWRVQAQNVDIYSRVLAALLQLLRMADPNDMVTSLTKNANDRLAQSIITIKN
ncbi:hypothetical protein D3C72_1290370 [compost metagenome]